MRKLLLLALLAACAPRDQALVSRAGADPGLAVDPVSGDLLLSYIDGDRLWFARSTDAGGTWSAPVMVADSTDQVHPHAQSAPRLVAARGAIALVWSNSIPIAGRQWPASNIRFARSTDGGRTWSAPLTLNDDSAGAPAGHLFHGAAWSGDSSLVVAWMDTRGAHQHEALGEPDATIHLAASADLGATWAPRNRALWGAACPCCRVSLARGPDGAVIAAWRKHYAGNVRDIVVAPLDTTAPEPERVHADGWVYPGCPHTGPGVTVAADGVRHIAWYTGKEGAAGVFYARAAPADSFARPQPLVTGPTIPVAHPAVAALPDGGALVVSDIGEGGARVIRVTRINADGSAERSWNLGAGGDTPQVVALADGRVMVAWTANDRIELRRLER